MRAVLSLSLSVAILFSASLSPAGWSSRRAGERIVAVPLAGNDVATPFGLSLSDTFTAGLDAINTPLPQSDYDVLGLNPGPFQGMANSNIFEKVVAIRRAVLEAIDTIGLQDPEIADCLLHLYRSRRLCLAFGGPPDVAAEIREDGSADCGDEALNLYRIPCPTNGPVIKLFEPQMFRLMNTLAHEGLHALQAGYNGPNPTTPQHWAQWALTNQCREIEASVAELERMSNTVAVLQEIKANLRLPANARGLPARIGATLLADDSLTNAQKRRKACELLACITGELLLKAQQTFACRTVYKQALEHYLAGQAAGTNGYNGAIKKTGWFSLTSVREIPEFKIVTTLAGGAQFTGSPPVLQGDKRLRQIVTDEDAVSTETSFNIDALDAIGGAWRWDNRLLVGGNSATTQEAILRGYLDTDNDGVVESGTGREILRSTALWGGFQAMWHPTSGKPWLFGRRSNRVYELTGNDADGFPTGLADRGALTSRDDTLYARFSSDANWAIGYSDWDIPMNKYSLRAEARYNASGNNYSFLRNSSPFAESQVAAAISEAPWPGSDYLRVTATPGRVVSAYQVMGQKMSPLGMIKADPNGHARFELLDPLGEGDQIVVGNGVDDWSPVYTVPDSYDAPALFTPRVFEDKVQFQAMLTPRTPYEFRYTSDLVTFMSGYQRYSSPMGNVFRNRTKTVDTRGSIRSIQGFYAGAEYGRPLWGESDHFTVQPGVSCTFFAGYNDIYPEDATFELTSPNTLDPERFTFRNDGSFDYVALSLQANFFFDYRIRRGTEVTAPVRVTINTDVLRLSLPPVRVDANGVPVVDVPCLVLGGKHYPTYQFLMQNSPFDTCPQPHWHSHSLVYSLETPTIGILDPNPPGCGHGRVSQVPQANFTTTLNDFENFKVAHVPPI